MLGSAVALHPIVRLLLRLLFEDDERSRRTFMATRRRCAGDAHESTRLLTLDKNNTESDAELSAAPKRSTYCCCCFPLLQALFKLLFVAPPLALAAALSALLALLLPFAHPMLTHHLFNTIPALNRTRRALLLRSAAYCTHALGMCGVACFFLSVYSTNFRSAATVELIYIFFAAIVACIFIYFLIAIGYFLNFKRNKII